jgi:hypothetical protein
MRAIKGETAKAVLPFALKLFVLEGKLKKNEQTEVEPTGN